MDISPILRSLGAYSKSNLVLLIFDEIRDLTGEIWKLAERHHFTEIIAGENTNLQEVIQLADNENCDGILFRLVERLDREKQAQFGEILSKMGASKKGKFILTSENFEVLHPELLKPLCKIHFTTNNEKPSRPEAAVESRHLLAGAVNNETKDDETVIGNLQKKLLKYAEGVSTAAQKNFCRSAAHLNYVFFGLFCFVVAFGAVTFIGLQIGLNWEQIFKILLTLTMSILMLSVGATVYQFVDRQIRARLHQIGRDEYSAVLGKLSRLNWLPVDCVMSEEVLRDLQKFWQNLTFDEALKSVDFRQYIAENAGVREMYKSHSGLHGNFVFEWYCRAAVEFYESKGFDITELKVIEFTKRLEIDGWFYEFFESYWVIYFLQETAKLYANASVNIVLMNAGYELSNIPKPTELIPDNGGWADVVFGEPGTNK